MLLLRYVGTVTGWGKYSLKFEPLSSNCPLKKIKQSRFFMLSSQDLCGIRINEENRGRPLLYL